MGVLMLLICTPLGFARLFTIVGDLVIRPNLLRNLDEDYYTAKFEEDCLRQKVTECGGRGSHSSRMTTTPGGNSSSSSSSSNGGLHHRGGNGAAAASPSQLAYYQRSLEELTSRRMALDRARRTPLWRRILGYPLVLLVLTALTSASLLCVVLNTGQIIAGFRKLPGKQVGVVSLLPSRTSSSCLLVIGGLDDIICLSCTDG